MLVVPSRDMERGRDDGVGVVRVFLIISEYYVKQKKILDKLQYCIEEKNQVCYSICIYICISFYRIETARSLLHHRPRVTDTIFSIGTQRTVRIVSGLVLNAGWKPDGLGVDDEVGIEAGPELSMLGKEGMLVRLFH